MPSHLVRSVALGALCLACVPVAIRSQGRRAAAPTAVPALFDVMEKSIEQLQRAMEAREVTSRQLVDSFLARIEAYDKQGPALNAIAAVNRTAREAADALDAERAAAARAVRFTGFQCS